jgi:hypothetical protein
MKLQSVTFDVLCQYEWTGRNSIQIQNWFEPVIWETELGDLQVVAGSPRSFVCIHVWQEVLTVGRYTVPVFFHEILDVWSNLDGRYADGWKSRLYLCQNLWSFFLEVYLPNGRRVLILNSSHVISLWGDLSLHINPCVITRRIGW